MTVVVESTLKTFPAEGLFQLQGPEVTKIAFNYVGRHLHCYFCFSYKHLPTQSDRPRSAFFKAADLDKDTVPTCTGRLRWGLENDFPPRDPAAQRKSHGMAFLRQFFTTTVGPL